MAQIQFYKTTSDKLNEIDVRKGNLIFVEDSKTIYMDNDAERVAYQQIIYLQNEEERITLTNRLVPGFYFVLTTNILWRLDSSKQWIQVTEKPSQEIVYGSLETFPRPGSEASLYRTNEALYHWDNASQSYVNYCNATPEWVVEI